MVAINNNINDQVGGSNSGVTNTLTIDNASNTASSQALLNVTVGGTSAGDAFQTFTVAGTTNWSQGIDNSDSDAYVVSASTALGTTNVIRAQTTGEINYPLQPAFFATKTVATSVVGNSATPYLVICDTEIADSNGDYDNTTGLFTAPVTGRYQLNANIRFQDLTSAMTYGSVTLTASNRTLPGDIMNVGAMRTADVNNPNFTGLLGYALMDMDAADTCGMYIVLVGGASAAAGFAGSTTFSGYLVC
jgi:hypothetical protein